MEEYTREPAATKNDFEDAFEGLVFPSSREVIVRKARDHGGIDSEAIEVLARIPEDRDYTDLDVLIAAVREVYASEQTKSPI